MIDADRIAHIREQLKTDYSDAAVIAEELLDEVERLQKELKDVQRDYFDSRIEF